MKLKSSSGLWVIRLGVLPGLSGIGFGRSPGLIEYTALGPRGVAPLRGADHG
jgi:hypothetical protein